KPGSGQAAGEYSQAVAGPALRSAHEARGERMRAKALVRARRGLRFGVARRRRHVDGDLAGPGGRDDGFPPDHFHAAAGRSYRHRDVERRRDVQPDDCRAGDKGRQPAADVAAVTRFGRAAEYAWNGDGLAHAAYMLNRRHATSPGKYN